MTERAVILAAGLGTRLRPLTWSAPKALAPLWGRPLLEHWLQRLESWGVREIAVNTHWLAPAVADFCRNRAGVARIVLSYEPSILGTGGALRKLRDFIGQDPVWLLNADVVASIDPAALRAPFDGAGSDPLATVWLDARSGPRTVVCDPATGEVLSYRSSRGSGTTFCGLQRVHPRVLQYLPAEDPCSIIDAYERAREAGERVIGVQVADAFWADAGTPECYLAVHDDIRRRWLDDAPGGEAFDPAWCRTVPSSPDFVCASPSAPPLPAALDASRIILGEGSSLAGNGIVSDVVCGDGCRLAGPARHTVFIAAAHLPDPRVGSMLRALGWADEPAAAQLLAERGSDRCFVRLLLGEARAIGVAFGDLRNENRHYARRARALAAAGVRVPRVLADGSGDGWLVLEDVGDHSLQDAMAQECPADGAPDRCFEWYRRSVIELARMHLGGSQYVQSEQVALESSFDSELYHWEHHYFTEHLVQRILGWSEARCARIERELERISERLLEAPLVLVHRDFQSSNVLLPDGEPCLIDFQGMRRGAAVYDLASLLYDAYVDVPAAWQRPLLQAYAQAAAVDVSGLQELIEVAGIQRLAQALGAFGRLGAAPGTARFSDYIRPAAQRLQQLAAAHGGLPETVAAAQQAIHQTTSTSSAPYTTKGTV